MGARLADLGGQLFSRAGRHLAVPVGLQQGFKALGLFQRMEVFTLGVFDHSDLKRLDVSHLADDAWHLVQACNPCGAPAAFAGHDFMHGWLDAGLRGAHKDGLQHAVAFDVAGQLVQRVLAKPLAWVDRAAHDLVDRHKPWMVKQQCHLVNSFLNRACSSQLDFRRSRSCSVWA